MKSKKQAHEKKKGEGRQYCFWVGFSLSLSLSTGARKKQCELCKTKEKKSTGFFGVCRAFEFENGVGPAAERGQGEENLFFHYLHARAHSTVASTHASMSSTVLEAATTTASAGQAERASSAQTRMISHCTFSRTLDSP